MTAAARPSRSSDEENAELLNRRMQRNRGNGPYEDLPSDSVLSNRHPFNIMKRLTYITVSAYFLNSMNVWHQLIHGSQVNHTWLQIALAVNVAILGIKTYLEMYQGRYKKRRVDYQNFRTATHIVMFLILFSTIAFFAALSPAYGSVRTVFIMLLSGFGILLPIMLLVPTWIQNPMFIILFTFFIQQYH